MDRCQTSSEFVCPLKYYERVGEPDFGELERPNFSMSAALSSLYLPEMPL